VDSSEQQPVQGQVLLQAQAGALSRIGLSESREDNLEILSSPLPGLIKTVLSTFKDKIPPGALPLLEDPEEFLKDPMKALNDPALKPLREQILTALEEPLSKVVEEIPGLKGALATASKELGKSPSEMVRALLACSSNKKCGDCTNGVNPCYWCAKSNSCHPVGSQQIHMSMSDSTCTDSTCQSQFPTSTCQSAYCADGSSVGNDNGPCGGRMSCGACLKGDCCWCGISGSCHTIGSQYYDSRCNDANCQSTVFTSSCDSGKCSDAVDYQPA